MGFGEVLFPKMISITKIEPNEVELEPEDNRVIS